MAQKEAIMRALMEAMGSSAPMTSKRPMARPKAGMRRAGASFMGEAGKTMSDADRMRQQRMDRAGMLQALEAGEMGQMSPIELERLRKKLGMGKSGKTISPADRARVMGMMGGGKVMKYESGGAVEVKGKKKKPKMGCVMKGRGGKYKGRS